MFTNKMAFMTCIDDPIRHRSTSHPPNRKAEEFHEGLDHITRFHNGAGHNINMIHINREFKLPMDAVGDEMDLTMNRANKGEHVPKAERNNQTLKDRIRMKCHRLPHNNIPKVMIKESVFDVAEKLNCFPPKNGMSTHCSPRMIMKQRSLDHKKDCRFEFGECVQACKEPKTGKKNTPTERTEDAIYLRPDKNWQEGHSVMNLNTGQTINARKLASLPVTESVIKTVEAMAE